MPRPSVTQVHYRIFGILIDTACIDAVFKVIRLRGLMPESYLLFPEAVPIGKQLIEYIVRIIYDEGGRTCEIGVGPGIRQDMHGYPHRLDRPVLCKLHRFLYQVTVGTAYQPVFIKICPAAVRLEIL